MDKKIILTEVKVDKELELIERKIKSEKVVLEMRMHALESEIRMNNVANFLISEYKKGCLEGNEFTTEALKNIRKGCQLWVDLSDKRFEAERLSLDAKQKDSRYRSVKNTD